MYTSLGLRKSEAEDLSVLGPGLVDHGDHMRLPRKGITGRSWENISKELIENQETMHHQEPERERISRGSG